MSYNTQSAGTDFSYVAVLLLLAYLMSSGPKYLRQFRETHNNIKIESVSPIRQVIQVGKFYTIDPYLKAWNKLKPAQTTHNLAAISNPVSR